MEDPKLLTRLREFCEAYKVKYAFEGVVEGFDTIDYVDAVRLTRGLFVRSGERMRLVQNESKRRPPVNVGDTVIVVGRDGRRGENSVSPAIILNPKGRYAFFSKDIQNMPIGRELHWYIPYFVGFGLLLIIPMIDYPWLYFLDTLFLFCWFCIDIYPGVLSRRPRSYHCDEQTWHSFTEEIETRFAIKAAT